MALSPNEERRQHPRYLVKLPLDYWQTPEVINAGLIANISETGLLIYSVHKIEIGTPLGIRVYYLNENRLDCIEGNAKIVWLDSERDEDWVGYRHGICIIQMPPDCHNRLVNYLLRLQEEENFSYLKRSSGHH